MTRKFNQQLPPWQYQHKPVYPETVPAGAIGFIYRIDYHPDPHENWFHRSYIGKKQLVSKGKIKSKTVTKTGKTIVRRNAPDVLSWQWYLGSCKPLLEKLRHSEPTRIRRTILQWAFSKRELSFLEDQYLHQVNALADTIFFNDNIAGRHFRHWLFPMAKQTKP